MCQVEVRSATPADASTISWLLADSLRGSYSGLVDADTLSQLLHTHCSLERIKAEVGIPGGAPGWLGWLVAADGRTVVGVGAGGVPSPTQGEVYALGVALERRREGVGSSLLTALSERQRDHGAVSQAISLPCPAERVDAPGLPFLTARGFTGSGTRLARPL
ncbi:GNAT family N-acetyltransferase [Streptomyces sp. AJS327]|uniref:GNAT family N-acetyltransferase n=1 Tax=Streptomyces sp. AJS327 TaxID=2545265 RepID=UPI0015DF28B2|nr:GNAT family N-acetyltransferase [Streptomyces sp. AJS327]MBA0053158.1 GNAT family N-acetyltransferase [Streptomyces sp. AJS327]